MSLVIRYDIWAVLLSLAAGQLYLQFRTRNYQGFPEGVIKTLRGVSAIPALTALICMFYSPEIFSGLKIDLPLWVQYFGLFVFNAGTFIVLWSHAVLGKYWSGGLATHPNHQLIDQGPYRYIRHPLYSAYIFMSLGYTLMTENVFVGSLMMIYSCTVATRVWSEEEMLRKRLGRVYEAYMQKTPRFIPRLRLARLLARS